jgi:hypothetical protein
MFKDLELVDFGEAIKLLKNGEKELEHWKAQSSQQIKKIAYGNQ